MKRNLHINTSTAKLTDPVTFRLPKAGTLDPFFGCARTFWNQHILPGTENNFKPPVKSIVVKHPSAKRGIRLISFDSAKKYFEALAQQQEPQDGNEIGGAA